MKEMKITSLKDLQQYSKGSLVCLPPFAENQPFVAMLKRPSMMALVRDGKIPNALLVTANSLFSEGSLGLDTEDSHMLDDVFQVAEVICEASFVNPTYAEMKSAGVTLTDEQLMFVFGYSQEGVKALDSFRKE